MRCAMDITDQLPSSADVASTITNKKYCVKPSSYKKAPIPDNQGYVDIFLKRKIFPDKNLGRLWLNETHALHTITTHWLYELKRHDTVLEERIKDITKTYDVSIKILDQSETLAAENREMYANMLTKVAQYSML